MQHSDDSLDALLNAQPAGEQLVLPVLGVPVQFASSAADILTAIEAQYGHWRSIEPHGALQSPHPAVHIQLSAPRGRDAPPAGNPVIAPQWLAPDRIGIRTHDIHAVADWTRQQSAALISAELLQDAERFRYGLLDTLTLFLLGPRDRQPFHAAAIAGSSAALLLTGRSGTGKSTLAYAAARAGLNVLSDDAVYLQSTPDMRVWGMRGALHLLPDAVEHFPELRTAARVTRPNGKSKLLVPAPSVGLPYADVAGLCILERSFTAAMPRRISADQATRELLGALDPGFDRFAASIQPILHRLASNGAWRVPVGGSPDDTIARITPLLGEVNSAS